MQSQQLLGLSKEATSEQLYNKLAEYKENPSGIQKFANDFTAAALKAGTGRNWNFRKNYKCREELYIQ